MLPRTASVVAVVFVVLGAPVARAASWLAAPAPTPTSVAVVTGATLDDANLQVTLSAAQAGSVQWLDHQGAVLATVPVAGAARTVDELTEVVPDSALGATVVFPGILPRLLAGSPLFALRFVPAGTVATAAPPWPFALSLACNAEFCRPQVIPGITVGPATRWASPQLGEYLDSAPPGQPVLEGALAAGVIGPALDFARVIEAEPVPFPGACHCAFALEAESPAQKPCGDKGLGIGVAAEGVSGERRIEAHRLHALTVDLPLRCFYRQAVATVYRTQIVSDGWKAPYEFPLPNLRPCSRPCEAGQPNFQFSAEGALAVAVVHSDETATADARWEVRAVPAGGAVTRASDSRMATGSNSSFQTSQAVQWSGGASRLDIEVDLTAGVSLPGKHQTASAQAQVDLTVLVEAASLCGDVSRGSGAFHVASAGRGLVSPDLDPTQINILIEGGCRP
ncbi:MAG: hypothetical protein SF066_17145 [Thermoanaerobaculia bacterium]|nr:hypothetical protein [Thermoanaerobaculia bacterium]